MEAVGGVEDGRITYDVNPQISVHGLTHLLPPEKQKKKAVRARQATKAGAQGRLVQL